VATRKKLPVVRTEVVHMSNQFFLYEATVVTTDGVPDWSTLKVK